MDIDTSNYTQWIARADTGHAALATLGIMLGLLFITSQTSGAGRGLLRLKPLGLQLPYPLTLITALGAAVRLPRLGENFWYDETFTSAISQTSPSGFVTALLGDVHPPLAYAPFWLVAHIAPGYSEWLLRLPAMLFGVAAIPIVYMTARAARLGRRSALIMATLTAALPAQVYYSAEARAYAQLTVLVMLAMLATLRGRRWLFVAAVIGIALTHNLGYVYLGLFCVLAIARWGMTRRTIETIGLTVIGGAVWLPGLIYQSRDVTNGFWLSSLTPQGVLWFITHTTASIQLAPAVVIPLVIGMSSLFIAGLGMSWHWVTSKNGLTIMFIGLGVPICLALTSWTIAPVYLTRAMLPCGLLVLFPLARALGTYKPGRHFLQYVTTIIIAMGLAGMSARPQINEYYEQCAGATAYYSTDIAGAIMALYYADLPVYVWDKANDLNQQLPAPAQLAMGMIPATAPPPGALCIVDFQTPVSSQHEARYLNQLSRSAGWAVIPHDIDPLFSITIYKRDKLPSHIQTGS